MLPIEEAIIEKLRSGPCCFDEVVTCLPNFGWGEIFVAVDCMSRDGRVFLRQLGFSTYQISLGSQRKKYSSASSAKGMQASLSGSTAGSDRTEAVMTRTDVEGWRGSPAPGV
jgi:hypothetical protein